MRLPFGQILIFPSKDEFFPCIKGFQLLPHLETSPHFQLTRQHSMTVSWTFLHISIVWCLMFETNQHRHLGEPSWVRYFIWHKSSRVCKLHFQCRGHCLITPLRDVPSLEPQPPTAAHSWPWANCILAPPERSLGFTSTTSALCTSLQKPSAQIQTLPSWQGCRAALGMSWCLWVSAPRKTLTDCPGRETETGLLFLLPKGCGETWISNAPKYLTQELVSNPDLV